MAVYQPDPGLSLEQRMFVVDQRTGQMQESLFGNGQPGEIARLDGRIDEVKSTVDGVKAQMLKWVGALSMAGIVLSLLLSHVGEILKFITGHP